MDDETFTIDSDTITIDSSTIDLNGNVYSSSGMTFGNITTGIGSIGSGGYIFNTNSTANNIWTTTPYITTTNGTGTPNLTVSGDAEFAGDVKIKGRSLEKLLTTIEDRLAILSEPDPEKLKKFAALKKAYDNYKLLEKLIGDDYKNEPTP
jgi:hypothetical protein